MSTHRLITALLIVFGLSSHTSANQEQMDDYQRWLQGTQQEFHNYLDANDKAFLSFLNQKWEEVDVQKAQVRDPKPKPVNMPVAKPAPVQSTPIQPAPVQPALVQPTPVQPVPSVQIPEPIAKPDPTVIATPDPKAAPVARPTSPTTQPSPVAKPSPVANPTTQPSTRKGNYARFEFFGNPVAIAYPRKFNARFRKPLKEKQIARYWKTLASTNHKPMIDALNHTASQLSLNDWGKALLIDQFSRALHKDTNSRALTSWFLLVKSGYDARIAYNKRVYLLMSAKQSLYGVTFFTMNSRPYYALGLNEHIMPPGQVYTYGGQHGAGHSPIDFSQPYRFAAGSTRTQRDLSFSYGSQSYQLTLDYPKGYISYLKDYPQLELPNYFSAGLPPDTAQQLLKQRKRQQR